EIVPLFYQRDADGLPRGWIQRVRASLSRLTPRFSANRMLREYVERFYVPAEQALLARTAGGGAAGRVGAPPDRALEQPALRAHGRAGARRRVGDHRRGLPRRPGARGRD